jgi:hypothetical protein
MQHVKLFRNRKNTDKKRELKERVATENKYCRKKERKPRGKMFRLQERLEDGRIQPSLAGTAFNSAKIKSPQINICKEQKEFVEKEDNSKEKLQIAPSGNLRRN